MRRQRDWRGIVLAVLCGLLWGRGSVMAAETPPAQSENQSSYIDGMTRKLGRGAINVLTCPLELIREPTLVGDREGGLAGMSVGLMKGMWSTLVRGGAGLYDLVTFPLSCEKDGCPSLVTPEFIWTHGDWSQ